MTRQPKNVSISFNTTKEINELIERAAAREMLTKSSWVNRAILAAASTVAKEPELQAEPRPSAASASLLPTSSFASVCKL
jgi:uncharacterized protein (DUF1778 family)